MISEFTRGDILTNGEVVLEVKSKCESFAVLRVDEKRVGLFVTCELFDSLLLMEGLSEFLNSKFSKYQDGYYFVSKADNNIFAVVNGPHANNLEEIMNLCEAFKDFYSRANDIILNDLIYIEEFNLLLPVKFKDTELLDANFLVGAWLSEGLNVSAQDVEKVCFLNTWLKEDSVKMAIKTAGVVETKESDTKAKNCSKEMPKKSLGIVGGFELPGRERLTKYFNEQIVDFIKNMDKYERMGITSVPATLLHGKPGCGKTYAVEKLAEFLGLPCFEISSSSVASPYIHDTSKKIAEVFEKAIEAAPSLLIIDEMEAYVSSRANSGTGTHHIEEVDEFLRNIPKAIEAKVIVFGMTNMIDMIDPAILRKGRFDFIEEVGMPSKQEIVAVLENGLKKIPVADDIDVYSMSEKLLDRPMSDVSYVVRQAARIAVQQDSEKVTQEHLEQAISGLGINAKPEVKNRTIGFRP